jgi:hypothetical protein
LTAGIDVATRASGLGSRPEPPQCSAPHLARDDTTGTAHPFAMLKTAAAGD